MNRHLRRYVDLWPLGLLSVLVSSRWLMEEAVPTASSSLLTEAVGCLVAAGFVCAFVAFRRSSKVLQRSRNVAFKVLGGALAFSGPAVAGNLFGRHISSNNGTLALALAPVVIATTLSILDDSGERDLIDSLWPGLAGVTGLLLLLPQPAFADWISWCALGAMPLLTGIGAAISGQARRTKEAGNRDASYSMVLSLLLAGILFGALAVIHERGRMAWSISACCLDALTAFLSLLTLARLGAMRWGSQFLLIPLLGLGEGIALLHPSLDVWSWTGMTLVAFSSLRLVLSGTDESSTGPPSLGLDIPLPRG